jgi:hypothetical protein
MMPGPSSRAQLSDKDLVESVLRELNEAADKWEALVGQAETVTYSVDLGDIHAVANADGRLVDRDVRLHPRGTGRSIEPRYRRAARRGRSREPGPLRRSVAVTEALSRNMFEPQADAYQPPEGY